MRTRAPFMLMLVFAMGSFVHAQESAPTPDVRVLQDVAAAIERSCDTVETLAITDGQSLPVFAYQNCTRTIVRNFTIDQEVFTLRVERTTRRGQPFDTLLMISVAPSKLVEGITITDLGIDGFFNPDTRAEGAITITSGLNGSARPTRIGSGDTVPRDQRLELIRVTAKNFGEQVLALLAETPAPTKPKTTANTMTVDAFMATFDVAAAKK